MAILICKMCGGTLEYDKNLDLAVCPYCGTRSTLFEQDRALFEQFQNMFAALLDRQPPKAKEEGFWLAANEEELEREDGERIHITYLVKRRADMCTMYVAEKHVLYVFPAQYAGYGTHYLDMLGKVSYPTPEMEKELKRYIPEPVTHCRLKDKSMFIAVNKEQGIYPLSMLGVLMDRHVAWVISRLENLCCLLEYNDMVLNALDVENLFVDPVNHQIYLYGGWWAAGFAGDRRRGAFSGLKEEKNTYRTDLQGIRDAAVRLLGFDNIEELKSAAILPRPFLQFLCKEPKPDARSDFRYWDSVLEKSYGERKFIPLDMTEEEIYGREIRNSNI